MTDAIRVCRAEHLGDLFMEKTTAWQKRWPIIGAIHGLGAMRTLELVRDPGTKGPAAEETKAFVQ